MESILIDGKDIVDGSCSQLFMRNLDDFGHCNDAAVLDVLIDSWVLKLVEHEIVHLIGCALVSSFNQAIETLELKHILANRFKRFILDPCLIVLNCLTKELI